MTVAVMEKVTTVPEYDASDRLRTDAASDGDDAESEILVPL
jgi:hypothetical protein